MGWVSQTTYVPTVWGNGGKPGGPTPPQLPFGVKSTPAPVAKDSEDETE